MAAIHRKSCIKFIPKSLVVSVVLVFSVGKAIVSKHVFWNAIPNSFFADFIFRNANDKNLVEGITEGSVVGTEEKQQKR